MFWVFAAIFYVGAILIDDGSISFVDFFQAFFSVTLGAFGVGQVTVNADDVVHLTVTIPPCDDSAVRRFRLRRFATHDCIRPLGVTAKQKMIHAHFNFPGAATPSYAHRVSKAHHAFVREYNSL